MYLEPHVPIAVALKGLTLLATVLPLWWSCMWIGLQQIPKNDLIQQVSVLE